MYKKLIKTCIFFFLISVECAIANIELACMVDATDLKSKIKNIEEMIAEFVEEDDIFNDTENQEQNNANIHP